MEFTEKKTFLKPLIGLSELNFNFNAFDATLNPLIEMLVVIPATIRAIQNGIIRITKSTILPLAKLAKTRELDMLSVLHENASLICVIDQSTRCWPLKINIERSAMMDAADSSSSL